jgi:hypothetical protein
MRGERTGFRLGTFGLLSSADPRPPDMTDASDPALAELEAAQRLATDPGVPAGLVKIHLHRAWMRLLGDETGDAARTIAHEMIDAHADPAVRDVQRRTADWLLEAPSAEAGALPEGADLLLHIELLRTAMGVRPQRDPVLSWALGFIALVLVVLMSLGTWGLVRGPTGPWQVQWFAERDFSGKARLDYVRQVDFDWGKGSPHRGIPTDDWSARFETCLVVDEETKIRFKLTSDDGSRLFVDGEKVVDNWGDHGPRARMGRRTFEPGVYHLQIDYYEARHGAKLVLEVAFDDDDDYGPLPLEWIRQPDADEDAPCG